MQPCSHTLWLRADFSITKASGREPDGWDKPGYSECHGPAWFLRFGKQIESSRNTAGIQFCLAEAWTSLFSVNLRILISMTILISFDFAYSALLPPGQVVKLFLTAIRINFWWWTYEDLSPAWYFCLDHPLQAGKHYNTLQFILSCSTSNVPEVLFSALAVAAKNIKVGT